MGRGGTCKIVAPYTFRDCRLVASVRRPGHDRTSVPRPRPGPLGRPPAGTTDRSPRDRDPRRGRPGPERPADPAPLLLQTPLGSPRIALQRKLLLLPGAQSQDYAQQIDDILALLAATYRTPEGIEAHTVPGEGADVEVWILGSSGGQSAEAAGARGLRFAARRRRGPL